MNARHLHLAGLILQAVAYPSLTLWFRLDRLQPVDHRRCLGTLGCVLALAGALAGRRFIPLGSLGTVGALVAGVGWVSWLVVGFTSQPDDPVINITGLLAPPGLALGIIAHLLSYRRRADSSGSPGSRRVPPRPCGSAWRWWRWSVRHPDDRNLRLLHSAHPGADHPGRLAVVVPFTPAHAGVPIGPRRPYDHRCCPILPSGAAEHRGHPAAGVRSCVSGSGPVTRSAAPRSGRAWPPCSPGTTRRTGRWPGRSRARP